MKKYLLIAAIVLTGSVPTFAHAAWWNPFSWFKNEEVQPVVPAPAKAGNPLVEATPTENISYTASSTNVPLSPAATTPPSTGADTDADIRALWQELQAVRASIQSTQTTDTAAATASNNEIHAALQRLEERLSAVEEHQKSQDYMKLSTRIESLEKKPVASADDHAALLKEIVKRVNSLTAAASYDGPRADYLFCDAVVIRHEPYADEIDGTRCNELYSNKLTY